SSSSAASLAVPSAVAEINCTRGAGLFSPSTSRISLARSVSPPTSAISGRSVRLANSMLRTWLQVLLWTLVGFRMRRAQAPAYDASGADHDPAENVAKR